MADGDIELGLRYRDFCFQDIVITVEVYHSFSLRSNYFMLKAFLLSPAELGVLTSLKHTMEKTDKLPACPSLFVMKNVIGHKTIQSPQHNESQVGDVYSMSIT